jgi:hypothetical protein
MNILKSPPNTRQGSNRQADVSGKAKKTEDKEVYIN